MSQSRPLPRIYRCQDTKSQSVHHNLDHPSESDDLHNEHDMQGTHCSCHVLVNKKEVTETSWLVEKQPENSIHTPVSLICLCIPYKIGGGIP